MADFHLRVCGEFIDVEAPALCNPLKRRSASAPPCNGEKGVWSEPDNGHWGVRYLARLPKRAATLHKSFNYSDSMEDCPTRQISSNATETTQAMTYWPGTRTPSTRAHSPSPTRAHSKEDLNAILCLKSQVADSRKIPGGPQQVLSNPWPDMPEAQYYPPLAEHFPHDENTAMQECSTEVKGPITTLMLCDLPCRLSILEVVDAMNLQGFSDTYDLIYMPRPKGLRSEKAGLHHNLGYAFVNFTAPEKAKEFAAVFSDVIFPGGLSMKKCYTKPAQRQGYKANWKKHSRQHKSGCLRVFQSTAQ